MTLLWACAWGLQSIAAGMEIGSVTGTPTIETTIKRSNGTALRVAPGATKQVQHASYSAGQGVKFYRTYLYLVTAPTATRTVISIDNGASSKVGIRLTSGRVLQLYNEEDLAQVGSDSSAINTGEWYRLELKVDSTTLASTAVEARLYAASAESTLLWNPSGTIDLAADPNRYSVRNNNDANLDFVVTDHVICDDQGSALNGWPGEGSLIYLRPDGDSGTPQWTRGGADSGANWSQVEDTPPNDVTDYVQSNTSGQIDDYTLGACPAAVGASDTIKWVAAGARFALSATTGGDPDAVLRITAGGNTEECTGFSGAGSTLWASYRTSPALTFPLVLTDMPGASTTPWTKSDLDGALLGLRESVTDTHFIRVSAAWLIFEHSPPGATPVSGTDSSTQSEASALESSLSPTETETLADAAALAASLDIADSVAHTDASALAAASSLADSGALSETAVITVTLALADSAALSEAAPAETATLAGTDSWSLADVSSLDIGAGADKVGVDSFAFSETAALAIALSGADSGALADGIILSAALVGSDSGVATDAAGLAAALPVVDSGLLAEALFEFARSLADSAALSESVALAGADPAVTGPLNSAVGDGRTVAATGSGRSSAAVGDGRTQAQVPG